MSTKQVTVTATLEDIFGNLLTTFAGVRFTLCGYGSQIPVVAGTSLLAQTNVLAVPSLGVVSATIFGNDQIAPANTYYTVQALDANGAVVASDAYRFTASATPVDISTITPITPDSGGVIAPLVPLVVVPYSNPMVFPALAVPVVTYKIVLTGNVTSSSMQTILPGQEVIFDIQQDSVGGHTFTFPANAYGTSVITLSTAPNSQSLALFGVSNDGTMELVIGAVGPTGATGAMGTPGATGATGPSGAGAIVGGISVVTPSSTPQFNLTGVIMAQLSPTSTATSSTLAGMVAGQTYVLSVAWGSTAYAVAWPAGLLNSTPLSPIASTTVYQNIVALSATTAVATSPLATP